MSNSDTAAFDLVLLGTLDPFELYYQCRKTGPNKIAEKYIATDAYCSHQYARDVLKGRFELGEEAIATDAYYSYHYAKYVLEGRFYLGEKIIRSSNIGIRAYVFDVVKGRWPEAEKTIFIDFTNSVKYAKMVLEEFAPIYTSKINTCWSAQKRLNFFLKVLEEKNRRKYNYR